MANSFKEYLKEQGKSVATVTHYVTYALDFISWLDRDNTELDQATAKEVLAFLNHLKQEGLANSTRNIRLNVIKQLLNYRIEAGHRSDNPVAHLKIRGNKQRKLYPIMSRIELDAIKKAYVVPEESDPRANRNWFKAFRLSKQRNKVVLGLMVNQGLTTTEVGRMQVGHLKLKLGSILIEGSRKSNARTMELRSDQIMELMEYLYHVRPVLLRYQSEPNENLFLSTPTAGSRTANDTLQIWKGLSKEVRAIAPRFINFKQVRTSVITHWLGRHNLRKVQVMAGHRFVSSTEAYLVNQMEDLQKDVDRFHPFG